MKSKPLLNVIITLVVFFVITGGIHFLLLNFVFPLIYKNFQVLYIYVFLLILSITGISLLFLVKKNDQTLMGKGYLAYSVIKIMCSVVFLYPWISQHNDFTRPFIYQFFGVFFPSLIIETLIILKLVNLNLTKNQKND